MATNQEIRDAIDTVLAGGQPKRVEFGDKTVEQYSMKELMDARKALDAEIDGAARETSGIRFGKIKFMGRNS